MRSARADWLRNRIDTGAEPLVLPGAYDALSARLVEASRAEGIYVGGFASIASAHGLPDVGLIEGRELTAAYERIAAVTSLPILVDIDTGYGSALNIQRTVKRLIDAGIAGFHIEDQANPKKCGHYDGKQVVPVAEAVARIEAALETVRLHAAEPLFVIARTDALQTEGVQGAIERAKRYREAGADALFVDAVPDVAALKQIRAEVAGPLLFNAASTGRSPVLSTVELKELGYQIVIHPIEAMLAAMSAARAAIDTIMDGGKIEQLPSFRELNNLLGLPEFEALDRKYSR